MAWSGINTSGIAFTLDTHFLSAGTIQWAGDTLVGVNADFNFALPPPRFGWRITPDAPQNFRITALSFSGPGYEPDDGEAIVRTLSMTLLEQDSDTSFAIINAESGPGATFVEYGPPSIPEDIIISSFQFLVEVEVPDPPPVPGEPYIIRNTARVYRGAVNNVKAWIRTEEGKLDLSAFATLEAVIWSGSGGAFRDGYTPGAWMWPNSGQNLLFTVPVTSPELGLALFQLPPSGNTLRWIPSSLCYTILGDGVPLATGLIEVVG